VCLLAGPCKAGDIFACSFTTHHRRHARLTRQPQLTRHGDHLEALRLDLDKVPHGSLRRRIGHEADAGPPSFTSPLLDPHAVELVLDRGSKHPDSGLFTAPFLAEACLFESGDSEWVRRLLAQSGHQGALSRSASGPHVPPEIRSAEFLNAAVRLGYCNGCDGHPAFIGKFH
jgi:hypothetical protein